MQFNFNDGNVSVYPSGQVALLINLPNEYQTQVNELNKMIISNELKTIVIKKFKKKRSISVNAYMWVLINKMAIKLKSTDEEIYIEMLKKYGTRDYVAALETAEPILKRVYKIVEPIKDSTINDVKSKTYRLIRGSSTYDVEEMKILVDGVVFEAKELEIETMTPNEINQLIEKWGEQWNFTSNTK